MHKSHLPFIFVIPLLLIILTSCSISSSPSESTQSSSGKAYETYTASDASINKANTNFTTLTNEIFCNSIKQDTLTLHYTLEDPAKYGIADYDITLGNMADSTAVAAQAELLEDYLSKLSACDYEALDDDNKLTYDVLTSYLQTSKALNSYTLYNNDLTTVVGVQTQLPVLLSEYTLNSEQDVTEYLTLLDDVNDYFAYLLEVQQQKADAGLFMSDTIANAVIKECETFIQNPESNYLISSFDDRINQIDTINQDKKTSYITQNKTKVLDVIIPSYQTLINGLQNLLGSGKNEGGLCYFPEGKSYYELLVRASTGSDKTIEQLEERVQTQLTTELSNMQQLIAKDATLSQQISDFSFSLTDPQEILTDLQNKIGTDFPALDTPASYTIKYVPECLESSMSPAFYLSPQMDNPDNNIIYINRSSLQTSASSLYSTLAHEGFPGHLYQTMYAYSHQTDPVRRLCSWKGYTEGWAMTVEYYSYFLDNNINPDVANLLISNSSATLAIYSLLDMHINYDGWTLEQTKEFLKEYYNINDETTANFIYQAMIARPSNYLQYYIGYLELLDLKQNAQETLGDNFTLKDFNTFILDIGEAPFPVISKWMQIWMQG